MGVVLSSFLVIFETMLFYNFAQAYDSTLSNAMYYELRVKGAILLLQYSMYSNCCMYLITLLLSGYCLVSQLSAARVFLLHLIIDRLKSVFFCF